MKNLIMIVLVVVFPAWQTMAEVKINALFSDNAVLQQGMPVPVWGAASDGEKVTVAFDGQTVGTVASNGQWMIKLKPLQANTTPQTMTVTGANTIAITNLLVGEVWLASGQSNMEWPLKKVAKYKESFTDLDKSLVRVFTVANAVSSTPKTTVDGHWVLLSSAEGPESSAVASFFAMNLLKELQIPVGIICNAWGGCRIEPWIPADRFDLIKGAEEGITKTMSEEQLNDLVKHVWDLTTPGVMYNAMINPVAGVAMRGAIWYQGESNVGDAFWYQNKPYSGDGYYQQKMEALIGSWRQAWNIGEFPFYFVQLAPFRKYSGEPLARMWEIQCNVARSITNTGMASSTDSKQIKNIHPGNKPVVGERLALLAFAKMYNKDIVCSGPLYRGYKIENNRVVVEFDHAESGLACSSNTITDVYIKGKGDEKFVAAFPAIEGSKLIVTHPEGKEPLHVRMGWNTNAMPNLMNMQGLPASPFRTDVE